MKCVICKQGETQPGRTTVVLTRDSATIVVKEVPADICNNCGEYYLSAEMTERILTMAEETINQGTELEVRRFAA